jgi:RNA polymerase sigma factor (sigma-70 family)
MGTMTDIEGLLARLRRGDAGAKQDLLARAHHRLERIASALFHRDFRRFRRHGNLDSVVNEAWIGMMRALESAQPATAEGFFGLMFVKVRQALLQIARRQRRHDARRLGGPLDGGEPDALEAFDRSDTANEPVSLAILAEFHRRVDSLPNNERRTFDLCYYGGFTQAQAARMMGLHPRQVSRLWVAATGRLAEWLRDREGLI